jgi:hypothetical protein
MTDEYEMWESELKAKAWEERMKDNEGWSEWLDWVWRGEEEQGEDHE